MIAPLMVGSVSARLVFSIRMMRRRVTTHVLVRSMLLEMVIHCNHDLGTYNAPRLNMTNNPIFFQIGNCNLHRRGSGNTTIIASIIKLADPIIRSAKVWFPQVPSIILFQL